MGAVVGSIVGAALIVVCSSLILSPLLFLLLSLFFSILFHFYLDQTKKEVHRLMIYREELCMYT